MIYIITPDQPDFNRVREKQNAGYHETKWINSWTSLMGLKIFKRDKVLFGEKFHNFDSEQVRRIKVELALRTEK